VSATAYLAGAVLAGAVLAGALAYGSLMKAMRTGEWISVTPFRHIRRPFGIGLGVLRFQERIDATMSLCVAIIQATDLLIAWHGRRTEPRHTSAGTRGCRTTSRHRSSAHGL